MENWQLDYEFSGLVVVAYKTADNTGEALVLTGGVPRSHRPRMYVPADCIENPVSVHAADKSLFGLSIIPSPGGDYLLEIDISDATQFTLSDPGAVTAAMGGSPTTFPAQRSKGAPADDDDWASLAYGMNLREAFSTSNLRREGASVRIALPAGNLRTAKPPLPRQEHELWRVTPSSGPSWDQAFGPRLRLETRPALANARIEIQKAEASLILNVGKYPGRAKQVVVVEISSECCMTEIPRFQSVSLEDFGSIVDPQPAKFPTVLGLQNEICGSRPHCNASLWIE